MPTIEIDEEQARRDASLRGTVQKITANPKAKRLMEEAYKLVEPNAPTPDLDRAKADEERYGKLEKELAEMRAEKAREKQEREDQDKLAALNAKVEAGFAKLRSQRVTEEGIEAVKKLMAEEGITNPEVAWDHIEKRNPPAMPISQSSGSGPWNFMEPPADTQVDLKKLMDSRGNNENVADKMARDALNEVRGVAARR